MTPEAPKPPIIDLLTVEEVAATLKVQPRTVMQWLKQGRLKGFKLGGGKLWRVEESDLRAFIDSAGA